MINTIFIIIIAIELLLILQLVRKLKAGKTDGTNNAGTGTTSLMDMQTFNNNMSAGRPALPLMPAPTPCSEAKTNALNYQNFMVSAGHPNDRAAMQIEISHLQSVINSTQTNYIIAVFGRVPGVSGGEVEHNTIYVFPVDNNGNRKNVEMDARFPAGHVDQKYPRHKAGEVISSYNYNALFNCP